MTTRFNVPVALRDHVELAADIHLPGGGPAPVVVTGTPYGKGHPGLLTHVRRWRDHGYAVVIYDVRGRGDSDGVWEPFRNEGPDGYDVIEWAAAQQWCDGNIGSVGASYSAQAQWLTALHKPPHLKAMVAYAVPSDPFRDWPTGVHGPMTLSWFRLVDRRVFQPVEGIDWASVHAHLPLATMDEAAGFTSVNWRRDLDHPPSEVDYWAPLAYQDRLTEVDLPVLHVTGWYDDVQPAALRNFTAMVEGAPSEHTRRSQRLVVGPWDHDAGRSGLRGLGGVDFGDHAQDVSAAEEEIRFLDHHLRGLGNGAGPQVRYFVMGTNEWRTSDEWPPSSGTERTSLYLHGNGSANLDPGSLTADPPVDAEPADGYTYDPADPAPFLSELASMQFGGPDDYADVHERPDVLAYSTERLRAELTISGPVTADLHVSTSAPDTDFTAMLLDIHPDGTRRRLCDGIVRLRYRDGLERETPATPGEIYRVTIDLWNTAHTFAPGHRIGLHIASSAYPKYDRNLNTGDPLATATAMTTAHNQVHHTARQPSCLRLVVDHGTNLRRLRRDAAAGRP